MQADADLLQSLRKITFQNNLTNIRPPLAVLLIFCGIVRNAKGSHCKLISIIRKFDLRVQ